MCMNETSAKHSEAKNREPYVGGTFHYGVQSSSRTNAIQIVADTKLSGK